MVGRRQRTSLVWAALTTLNPRSAVASEPEEVLSSRTFASSGLKGRFLHITDLHPDPHYRWNATLDAGCHWEGKGKGKAGYWGTAVSDCDSPPALMNTTFDWLKRHWYDSVDFVIWTGDSARHDLDPKIPRSLDEIVTLNRDLADRMRESFAKGVKIIPSIGNNDVYPHNVMPAGPSHLTSELSKAWKHFVPEQDFHVFQRGAYFAVSVIPKRLAVISLNTIFFYHSNTLVDGCPDEDELAGSDPGSEELDWLDVQLQRYKAQKMQVYLTGHVPPSASNWYKGCYNRYGRLSLQYQDTILGHLYGHMNQDHFSLISADEFRSSSSSSNGPIRAFASLDDQLMSQYKGLPKRKKTKLSDFAIVNIAPSVVPTYQPSARVWIYNVTKPPAKVDSLCVDRKTRLQRAVDRLQLPFFASRPSSPTCGHVDSAPVRSNRFLSPLAYTQFFVRLPRANKHGGYGPGRKGKARKDAGGERPQLEWEVEYTTATRERFLEAAVGEGTLPLLFPKELAPADLRNLTAIEAQTLLGDPDLDLDPEDGEDEEAEDDGDDDVAAVKKKGKRRKWMKLVPWSMEELTLGSWIELARRLGKGKKAWDTYRRFMVVSAS